MSELNCYVAEIIRTVWEKEAFVFTRNCRVTGVTLTKYANRNIFHIFIRFDTRRNDPCFLPFQTLGITLSLLALCIIGPWV